MAADLTPGLDVSVHLDERSGGFFALGLAKASRSPVALVCTSGTAAANYLPAVVEAFHSGVPLVVLPADRPSLGCVGSSPYWCWGFEMGLTAAGVESLWQNGKPLATPPLDISYQVGKESTFRRT